MLFSRFFQFCGFLCLGWSGTRGYACARMHGELGYFALFAGFGSFVYASPVFFAARIWPLLNQPQPSHERSFGFSS